MKILKEVGNYSQSKKDKNTKLAIIFIILAIPTFAVSGFFAIIVFFIGVGFLRTSVNWKKGIVGEEKVTNTYQALTILTFS